MNVSQNKWKRYVLEVIFSPLSRLVISHESAAEKIVPSNHGSWFVLFCYLMEGRNERLSTNSWPIPVRGKTLSEVTICLISVLTGATLGCLLDLIWGWKCNMKTNYVAFLQQECFSMWSLVGSENIDFMLSWLVFSVFNFATAKSISEGRTRKSEKKIQTLYW